MFQISYHESNVKQAVHTKLLGLDLDHHVNWKTHTDEIIPKFSRACYTIISVYFLNDVSTFTIYYAYFHSVMKYGIIFQSNSPFSKKVLQIPPPLFPKKKYIYIHMNYDRVTN